MHVLLAGGGTAGHIEPALNLADALRRHDPAIGITLLGTDRGLEVTLVPKRGYELALVPAVPLPRRPSGDLLAVPSRVSRAVTEARRVIDEAGADVVVGFGGYVALPAYLAARRARVPIVVHEANARAGLANRVGARLTRFVAETVPGSLPRARLVGLPLRPAIAGLDRAALRTTARQEWGLEPDRPTLLAFGGSQGARRLNAAMAQAAPTLAAQGVQVLHAVGPRNVDSAQDIVITDSGRVGDQDAPADGARPPYRVVPYLDRMDLAYAAADLAVCRSGAMTCAELAAVGLPAVYVPLPIGNGEQRLNALPVVRAGGGLLLDDAHLDADRLLDLVLPLLADPAGLAAMARAAASEGRRDADERLVAMVHEAARSRRPEADGGEP